MSVLVRVQFLESFPIAAHYYMANLVSGGGVLLKSPPIAAHCSPHLHGNFSRGGGGGGNSSKVLPLQPNSYIILPPLSKIPPHSYINLPPIDKLPPPPPSQQNGRIFGRTFDPGESESFALKIKSDQTRNSIDNIVKKFINLNPVVSTL